jgi:hypothetical protein
LAELDGEAAGECDGRTPRQAHSRRGRSDHPHRHHRPQRVAEDVTHNRRQGAAAPVHGQAEYDRRDGERNVARPGANPTRHSVRQGLT